MASKKPELFYGKEARLNGWVYDRAEGWHTNPEFPGWKIRRNRAEDTLSSGWGAYKPDGSYLDHVGETKAEAITFVESHATTKPKTLNGKEKVMASKKIEEIETPKSSHISRFKYSPKTQVLFVTFARDGAEGRYLDVPEKVFKAMKKAKSKGSFLHKKVIGTYDFVMDKGALKNHAKAKAPTKAKGKKTATKTKGKKPSMAESVQAVATDAGKSPWGHRLSTQAGQIDAALPKSPKGELDVSALVEKLGLARARIRSHLFHLQDAHGLKISY